jgi:hypothetical protein
MYVEWAREPDAYSEFLVRRIPGGFLYSLGMLERFARTKREYRTLEALSTRHWPISIAFDRLPGRSLRTQRKM